MKTCYIIGAGEADEIVINKKNDDFIIAADGGVRHCALNNISPDLIIGDFDSLGFVPDGENVYTLPVEKDDTDTSYSVKYALDKGYKKIVIYGGTGGKRPDHTYANIALVAYISKHGGQGFLVGNNYVYTAITDGAASFSKKLKGDLSVFSFDEKAFGVFEQGFKYELYNKVLKNSNGALGVSNSFIGEGGHISVSKGTLIIYYTGKVSDISIDK